MNQRGATLLLLGLCISATTILAAHFLVDRKSVNDDQKSVRDTPGSVSHDAAPCGPIQSVFRGQSKYFTEIEAESGFEFTHTVGPLGSYFMPEINGAGGAMFDADADGDLDLFLVNSGRSPQAPGEFQAGTRTDHRYFRQDGGRFVDATQEAGLSGSGEYGIGCTVGDFDNDGDLDLYVTCYGQDRLFANRGDATFEDVTDRTGINSPEWGTCAAFFDYDRDGWLDLVVVNYTADPLYGHSVACGNGMGKVSYCGPKKFEPVITQLYHNEAGVPGENGSQRRFRDVTYEAGLGAATAAGFGVICADFSGDGWPDIFVANDMDPNRLWINRRDGTFQEEAVERGAAFDAQGRSLGCMGIAVGDPENDGDLDLLITNMVGEGSTLYENQGAGNFIDVAGKWQLTVPTRLHTGWGVGLIDVNHDGFQDVAMVNGLVVPCHSSFAPHGEDVFHVAKAPITATSAFWGEYADANLLFLSDGLGGFQNVTARAGDFGSAVGSGRAMIYGDIDNDGDLDLLVTNAGEQARLYRNDVPKSGRWLMVRAIDPALHREAYGAVVTIPVGGRTLTRLLQPSDSYLASNDSRLHFGLGNVDRIDEIRIRWPDGLFEAFPVGELDRVITLERGAGRAIEETP